MKNILYVSMGVLSVFLGWILLSLLYPPAIIPPLIRVFSAFVDIIGDERFISDLGSTLLRVWVSFFFSLIIGVALGLLAGVLFPVSETLHPIMIMSESAPPMAWLVIAILLFGMGHGPSFLVGLSAAVPIFYFNTVIAVKGLDTTLIEMASSFNVSKKRIFRSIYVPGILMSVIGASSSSLSVIWRVVIMAEAFTTARGLGPQLWGSYLYSESEVVYGYILIIVFLGFSLEYGLIKPSARFIKRKLRVDIDAA
ncbi:MAG: ABC transporter permease subunit [Sphaerochaetaceae bacterium]|nr:ABC transporter permease subunit [Sphaerochaetaceae bacterium]